MGSVWPPRGSRPLTHPSLSPLYGQEVNNFRLPRWPSNSRRGSLAPQTPKGPQDKSEKELELELGPKASGGGSSTSISTSTSTNSYHSSPGPMANGYLSRKQLMYQAAKDLPEGVDPAQREVGARDPRHSLPQPQHT